MSVTELFCYLMGTNLSQLTKNESLLLEVELFAHLCDELKKLIRSQYKEYFRLMKLGTDREEEMLDSKLMSCIVKDIISTEEYTLSGIANYVRAPEEVIVDIASGQNENPSLMLSRKIIDLHRSVRRESYQEIMRKITQRDET